MNRQGTSGINFFQLVVAVLKLIVFAVLPLIVFSFAGVIIPGINLYGIRMFNMGNMYALLPLFAYLLLLVFTIGPLRKYGLVAAGVALIAEIIFFACAAVIAQSGDINFLISLIPADYRLAADIAIAQLAKPGFGLLINLLLTVVYGVLQFVNVGGTYGVQAHAVAHRPSIGKQSTGRSGGSRPHI